MNPAESLDGRRNPEAGRGFRFLRQDGDAAEQQGQQGKRSSGIAQHVFSRS
jgi:hypothetical protein